LYYFLDYLCREVKQLEIMSKITDLEKMLCIVQNINIYDWKTVILLQKNILEKKITVINSTWEELYEYKNKSEYYGAPDLANISTWSTYDGQHKKRYNSCINLNFQYKDTKSFICEVEIYDGDILNGHRTNLRFTANLKLPIELISIISGWVNAKFNRDLDYQYDDYLEAQRKEWMLKRKQELLNIK